MSVQVTPARTSWCVAILLLMARVQHAGNTAVYSSTNTSSRGTIQQPRCDMFLVFLLYTNHPEVTTVAVNVLRITVISENHHMLLQQQCVRAKTLGDSYT